VGSAGKMAALRSAGCSAPVLPGPEPRPRRARRGTQGDAGVMAGDARNKQLQTRGPDTPHSQGPPSPRSDPLPGEGFPSKHPPALAQRGTPGSQLQRGASAAAVGSQGKGRDGRGEGVSTSPSGV